MWDPMGPDLRPHLALASVIFLLHLCPSKYVYTMTMMLSKLRYMYYVDVGNERDM